MPHSPWDADERRREGRGRGRGGRGPYMLAICSDIRASRITQEIVESLLSSPADRKEAQGRNVVGLFVCPLSKPSSTHVVISDLVDQGSLLPHNFGIDQFYGFVSLVLSTTIAHNDLRFSSSFVSESLFLSKSKNSSGIASAVGSSSGSW